LDVILKLTLCACILHNLLLEHPVPPDWFDDDIENLEQDNELNQYVENSSLDTRCNQVFAYMLEGGLGIRTSAMMIPAFKKNQPSSRATI